MYQKILFFASFFNIKLNLLEEWSLKMKKFEVLGLANASDFVI